MTNMKSKLYRKRIGTVALAILATGIYVDSAFGQNGSNIVRPGAPGQATRVLPPDTRGQLPPISPKDVEFMQGMIHHHAQAVEMTDLMESRTENAELRNLGSRISQTQADEMNMMRRWLRIRGFPIEMQMSADNKQASGGHEHHGGHNSPSHEMLMPGMLSKAQMDALRSAKGAEFDRLFLSGMIQHHIGALVMVKELFETAGAGQDAELFNFATDVDTSQRAEIRIMQQMLAKIGENKDHRKHDHH